MHFGILLEIPDPAQPGTGTLENGTQKVYNGALLFDQD